VTFEVNGSETIDADLCNCSICKKSGFLHMIVPKQDFKLISGQEYITEYTFNSGVAKHTFCKVCGVKPFYIPRSNPDGIDVNVNCLDTEPGNVIITEFDGLDWEKNAHTLAHKSIAKD
jgi:hypothetical protein